ncbi:hypothetical protein E1200_19170 [Actinomadura sp. GC306]|uniref:EthD domain-containing protein n=1 Tax=Actinomadura sp. GC306 TaxID=2530367 RepID=UPI0010511075|nr:EthD domain-containing protein [Actinomadura sp. GC306]TDC65012.1 hypothetical protein E1200_19170 [Actinomadura sp. GC306]
MIKRITFVTRSGDVPAGRFPAAWRDAAAGALDAPDGVRPVRAAVCTTLPGLTGPGPGHDGIGIEWFADVRHLERFETWLGTPGGPADPAASAVVAAEESVMRGAGWLDRRWRAGGERLKHMAVAVRAEGLAPAEFSERWRGHAGRTRAAIPDRVRGLAYVQNHPLPRAAGDWAYDAVNEVYFDDEAGLRARIAWFRENLPGPVRDDLFRASWFLAVREEVLAG